MRDYLAVFLREFISLTVVCCLLDLDLSVCSHVKLLHEIIGVRDFIGQIHRIVNNHYILEIKFAL